MRSVSPRIEPRFIASLALIGILSACTGSQGPAGPTLTGTRAGVVYLYDEFGGNLSSDSGMTVTANPGAISSVTNTAGQYSLDHLKTGVYTITFVDPGFGKYLQVRVGFVGGGTSQVGPTPLGQVSTGVISALNAAPNAAGDTILVQGMINAAPLPLTRIMRLFFSASSTPSAAVGSYTITTNKTGFFGGPFKYRVTGLDIQSLRNNFSSGSTVYVIAYTDSYYENTYLDSTSGQMVYPNVSPTPSNVASFTMP